MPLLDAAGEMLRALDPIDVPPILRPVAETRFMPETVKDLRIAVFLAVGLTVCSSVHYAAAYGYGTS